MYVYIHSEFRVVMSVTSSVLWCPLRVSHKNDVLFVFTSGSNVLFTLYVSVCCLCCFSSSCILYVASFSGLSIFDCPFGMSLTFVYVISVCFLPFHSVYVFVTVIALTNEFKLYLIVCRLYILGTIFYFVYIGTHHIYVMCK